VDDMYALADEITGPLRTVKRGQHCGRLQQWRQVAKLFVILKHCRYLNELERCYEEGSSLNSTDTAELKRQHRSTLREGIHHMASEILNNRRSVSVIFGEGMWLQRWRTGAVSWYKNSRRISIPRKV
jgi:hypothetical protein